ncbi:50S ribosomal protein L7 (mitochondrion) [Nitzschia inconspicua]|uniref:50S ribosomal protein L7 n=1 Tax=Nitzschia inconspicua TaxID=303405 RepID=A0A8H2SIJ9_9STRA|nr:50S ribosomal protein L7 [Nitzschia inconspicua]
MKNLKKRYSIKIPKNIQIIYCDKKNIITFMGPLFTKSLKLKIKLFLIPASNLIVASQVSIEDKSVLRIKDIKKIQGTTIAKIKQILIEITHTLYCKLNLVGVGYRVFTHENLVNQVYLKLGYSHLVYFRIPSRIGSHCQKFTKLFLFGNSSYDLLMQTAAQIRNCKLPEPYKGKGILYDQEKIILKKGKKI